MHSHTVKLYIIRRDIATRIEKRHAGENAVLGYQTRFATAGHLLRDCLVNRVVISAPGDGLSLVILDERELRGEKQVSPTETRERRGRQLGHDQRQRGGLAAT